MKLASLIASKNYGDCEAIELDLSLLRYTYESMYIYIGIEEI
jgi:hypothetical protein